MPDTPTPTPPPLRWPAPTEPIAGVLRAAPEDFMVVERLAFDPAGEGEHLLVRFRKLGLSTPEAVRRMAEALGLDPRGAGWAGLKDRHAVTEQWASLPGGSPEAALALRLPDLQVLEAARHPHKLRPGRLLGNRFELRVRGEAADPVHAATLRARWEALRATGLPNYFGRQRFGRRGDNASRALRWLRGEARAPRSRFERKMLPSALQAALFNEVLAARVADGSFAAPAPGEVVLAGRDERGATMRRLQSGEAPPPGAIPTGPLFGPRMPWPRCAAVRRLEADTLARWGLALEDFRRFGRLARGGRRALLVPLGEEAAIEWEPGALRLRFELPAGAYATVLVEALLGAEPVEAPRDGGGAPSGEGC